MILLQDDLSWLFDLGIIAVIIGLVLLAIWIWAIIDIVKRPMSGLMKIIWIVVVIAFPFIGVLLYIFLGRNTSSTNTDTRRY